MPSKRSIAAKKGWTTRRRKQRVRSRTEHWGVEIEIGYNGSQHNSYTLVIHIRPYKRLADDQIADLCETLAHEGHFNGANGRPDYTFVQINDWEVTERGLRIRKGTARLIQFTRRKPGLLAR